MGGWRQTTDGAHPYLSPIIATLCPLTSLFKVIVIKNLIIDSERRNAIEKKEEMEKAREMLFIMGHMMTSLFLQ